MLEKKAKEKKLLKLKKLNQQTNNIPIKAHKPMLMSFLNVLTLLFIYV